MRAGMWSEQEEIDSLEMQRPHLVILGAGASLAAFPGGDRNGHRLPVMRNLIEVVGLTQLCRDANIPEPYDDFEAIYSDIAQAQKQERLKTEIETRIYSYFQSLSLPDTPCLYDHLVLCLRKKDVIATFNWDPFLCQAARRNRNFAELPTMLFLHGNVAFTYCPDCKTAFPFQAICPRCSHALVKSPLLFPVKRKDYQNDPAIAHHWKRFEFFLKNAWALTIFGYGAPKTDVEAVRVMKGAWGDVKKRNLEQTEIIDIRAKTDIGATWSPFIHAHHYDIRNSFYGSYIARHPRRSGEALWAQLMECRFLEDRSFPRDLPFEKLYEWLKPRVDAEIKGSHKN